MSELGPSAFQQQYSTGGGASLLTPLPGEFVLGTSGKNLAAVGECNFPARSIVGAVLRQEAFHHNLHAYLYRSLPDVPAHQLAGRAARKGPLSDLAIGAFLVDKEPDVRILPIDLRHNPSDLHGLVTV